MSQLRSRQQRRRALLRRKRIIRRIVVFGGLFLFLSLILYALIYLFLRAQVKKTPDDIICSNVYIGDIDVSHMKASEAEEAVKKREDAVRNLSFTLTAREASLKVTGADMGLTVKGGKKAVKEALSYGKEGGIWHRYRLQYGLKKTKKTFKITYNADADTVTKIIKGQMPPMKDQAVSATLTRENGEFVITEGVKGYAVDVEKSVGVVTDHFSEKWDRKGGKIALVTKIEDPKVQAADLKQVRDVLGSFTTVCGTGGGRVQNIVSGASHIDGALVMPGEVFSANAAMEPYTEENGYTLGGSFEDGELVQSMGGGICQVSTTLYNAALRAELGIVQRAAHSMRVGYVEPSMDAAIAGDYKDLKFENNGSYPVYIEGYVAGGKITFNIYGRESRNPSRQVSFVSEVIKTTPAGEKFNVSGDPLGTMVKTQSGSEGMQARLWKVVTENGVEISRDVINRSTYNASNNVWSVGTATDNAEAAAKVKDAVKAGNRQQIEAAIAEAKALAEGPAAPPEGAPGGAPPS